MRWTSTLTLSLAENPNGDAPVAKVARVFLGAEDAKLHPVRVGLI